MKWTEGPTNKVSIIIRRYTDHTRFAAYMAVSIITFFSYSFGSVVYHCTYGCMLCMLLFNFVQVSLIFSYCYVCSVLGILFHCVFLCIFLCVHVYSTTAIWCQPNCS